MVIVAMLLYILQELIKMVILGASVFLFLKGEPLNAIWLLLLYLIIQKEDILDEVKDISDFLYIYRGDNQNGNGKMP